jgi:hypothetical protein
VKRPHRTLPREPRDHEIAVEYYSHSTAFQRRSRTPQGRQRLRESRRQAQKAGKENAAAMNFRTSVHVETHPFAARPRADDKGKPFKMPVTIENLDSLTDENLNAIDQAIKDDIAAKK